MVVSEALATDHVSRIFQALADPTRRDILSRVMASEASVTELADRYDMSFAAVQKHVAILERAGLVLKRREGRMQRVGGDAATLRRAAHLLHQLEQIWLARVSQLDDLIASDTEGDTHARSRRPQGPRHAHADRRRRIRRSH